MSINLLIKKARKLDIILLFNIIMFFCCLYFRNQVLIRTLLLLLFVILCCDAILNIKKKYIHLFFYFTFFIFTMGQYVFMVNNESLNYTNFSSKINITTMCIQFTALLTIYLGSRFCDFANIKRKPFLKTKMVNINKKQVYFLYILLGILFLLSAIINIEIGIQVFKNGYLSLYNGDFHSIYPSYLRYLSDFFPLMCFICLAIFKTKKEILSILFFYFLYLCLTLLSGVRGEFGIGMIIIMVCLFVFYIIIWKTNFNWTRKKISIILASAIMTLILLFSGLNAISSLRNKQTVESKNILVQLNDFFVSQSNSLNLIFIAQSQEKVFDERDTLYTFGPVLNNVEAKIQKIVKNFELSCLTNKSTSFGIDVSKISLGEEMYSQGHGLGSQYLAELYIDYGFPGIIIYNLLLGMLLSFLSKMYTFGVFGFSFTLLLLQSILYIPRNEALQFVNSMLSFNYWLLLFAVLFILNYRKIKLNLYNKVNGGSNV